MYVYIYMSLYIRVYMYVYTPSGAPEEASHTTQPTRNPARRNGKRVRRLRNKRPRVEVPRARPRAPYINVGQRTRRGGVRSVAK